jgi:hypothetical protein
MVNVEGTMPALRWIWQTEELSQIVKVLDQMLVEECQNQAHLAALVSIISMASL